MTKDEIKRLGKPIKLKVRTGDKVVIISGKDKGEIGFIAVVSPTENKVLVLKENLDNPDQPLPLNVAIKHRKARSEQEKSARVKIPVPIHVSNVMVIDPNTNEPTRVGRRKNDAGKLERYGKKSGKALGEKK